MKLPLFAKYTVLFPPSLCEIGTHLYTGVASRINTLLRHYGTRVVLTGICFTHDFTGRSQHDFQTQRWQLFRRCYVFM